MPENILEIYHFYIKTCISDRKAKIALVVQQKAALENYCRKLESSLALQEKQLQVFVGNGKNA